MAKKQTRIRTSVFTHLYASLFMPIKKLTLSAYSRTEKAGAKPREVHLMISLKDVEVPWIMRFKNPKKLGKVIEEMVRYRDHVWPDAEALDLGQ